MKEKDTTMQDQTKDEAVTENQDFDQLLEIPSVNHVKKVRKVNTGERAYFIKDANDKTVLENQQSEKDCEKWILANGEYDMPYFIGYNVMRLIPITKEARIALKR